MLVLLSSLALALAPTPPPCLHFPHFLFHLLLLPPLSFCQQWSTAAEDQPFQQYSPDGFPHQNGHHRRRPSGGTWTPTKSVHHPGSNAHANANPFAKDLQRRVKRPPSGNSFKDPLSVKLGFYLESLGDFRETQMSFEVDLYMYMSWKDPSLQHPGPDMAMINEDIVRKQLWLPDLYFANARQANFHQVTVPNFNLFISPDGTVAYSSRVTLNVACNLNLVDYPMDDQQCHIRVLSYAYIAKMVNVTWFRHSPIMYNPHIDLPEFEIDQIKAEYCDGTYRYAVTERSSKTDKFSCLMGNLYLRRRIGFNMVQSYIPTGLIVIISWVSFWIDRRAVPARVTLSFTTLLTMTTIGNGMRFGLPRVSYAKAIDYWFGGCMLFVFLALVEYALVNSYMRRSDKYERLANKYKRKSSTELLTVSPIFASELAQSYAEMLKLRRKSTFFDFYGSPILNRRKVTKESSSRDETSLSLSDEQSTTEQSKSSKKRSNGNGKDGQQEKQQQEMAKNNNKKDMKNTDENEGNEKNDGGEQRRNANEVPMNGSYYDNMHLNVPTNRRKGSTGGGGGEQKILVPNGTVRRKMGGLGGGGMPRKGPNSVAFAVDNEMDKKPPLVFEDEYLWPKVEDDEKDGNKKVEEVEPNPQLYCKYLEVCQLLSRRALNIDKISRIFFPLAFVLFNLLYWGYYLVLRKRKLD